MTDTEKSTITDIEKKIHNGELSNESLVQIIELCGRYLNIQTVSEYAKHNNISDNGARKYRNKVKIFNRTFIIENE